MGHDEQTHKATLQRIECVGPLDRTDEVASSENYGHTAARSLCG